MMSLDVDMNLILIKTESKISNVINYLKVIINEIGRANSKDSSAIESGVSIEKLSAVSRLLPVDLWHIALLAVGGDLQDS